MCAAMRKRAKESRPSVDAYGAPQCPTCAPAPPRRRAMAPRTLWFRALAYNSAADAVCCAALLLLLVAVLHAAVLVRGAGAWFETRRRTSTK